MKLPAPHISLSTKIFVILSSLTFTAVAATNVLLYHGASTALRDQVREHLKAIAATTAGQISPELHEQIQTRADEGSPAYQKIRSVLTSARKANQATTFIYTMRKSSIPNQWQFVVDAEGSSKLKSHVGDKYDVSKLPEMIKAFSGPSADTNPSKDQWGWYLSGYAPIVDAKGDTVAIVGVDMSIEQLRAQESALCRSALLTTLGGLVTALLLGSLITKRLTKLIYRFTRAAQRVRNGDFDFRLSESGSKEIKEFAASFNGMIAGLKESRDLILEGSSRDFLTGLYNHMYLHQQLQNEIERADGSGQELAVLMIDVDRFKGLNDSLGHPVGDSILRQLAMVFRTTLRSIDIPVRYGGDEFAAILPDTDKESAVAVAERLRAAIEAYPFTGNAVSETSAGFGSGRASGSVHITVTIGVACYPMDQAAKDGLIMAADIALCRAKHICRNSVLAYKGAGPEGSFDPNELYQMLHDPNGAAVASLAAAVDARDRYTSGHSERVAAYAQDIAEAMNSDQETIDRIRIAGMLHDLGKIGVSDAVLNKPGSLTKEEREEINQHPSLGADILKRAPHLDQIIPAVIYHHERWDGAGYPSGLKGVQIPLIARIMAIADAFDAMTSDRPYRKALSVEEALIELEVGAGSQFDPDLVRVFIDSAAVRDIRKAA